jgi:hypothetical protein
VAVTESPKKSQPAIIVQGSGRLSGTVDLQQNMQQTSEKTFLEGNNIPATSGGKNNPFWVLRDGDKISIPVQGELQSIYLNSRTGQAIGQGSHQVTGETVLTLAGDQLQSEIIFDNNFSIAVEVPQSPVSLDCIGASAGYMAGRFIGQVYYQHDFLVSDKSILGRRVQIAVPVRFGYCCVDGYGGPLVQAAAEIRW